MQVKTGQLSFEHPLRLIGGALEKHLTKCQLKKTKQNKTKQNKKTFDSLSCQKQKTLMNKNSFGSLFFKCI